MQDDAAQNLHVEVPHILGAQGRLPTSGIRLRQQIVQGGALSQPLAKHRRQRFELFVAQSVHFLFEDVYLIQHQAGSDPIRAVLGADVAELADEPLIAGPKHARQKIGDRLRRGGQTIPQLLEEADVHGGCCFG